MPRSRHRAFRHGRRLHASRLCLAVRTAALLLAVSPGCDSSSQSVVSIALHPTKPQIMYVATNDAIYKTRDHGDTWLALPVFSARRVTTVVIDPKFPATLYAGTMGDAVYKSPDGGRRWLPHNVGLKEHVSFVNQFVFHPHDSRIIFAATTVGAYLTRDGGRLWEERMTGMTEVHIVVSLALNPKNPQVVYAGTSGGVYRSTDMMSHWEKVNRGLIPEEILDSGLSLGVNVLVVDPVETDRVYAGTTKGLFKSDNGADSWARIGASLPDQFISALVVDPTDHRTLYAGGRAGVFKSDDGGASWNAINEGLKSLNIRSLAISPRDPQELFAGTNGSGVYASTNGGRTWTSLPLEPKASSTAQSP